MTSPVAPPAAAGAGTPVRVAVGILSAAVVAALANLAVAAVARALGASDDFVPLQAGPVVTWSVIGVVVSAVGWALVRARTRNPRRVLRVLVPVVLAVTLVPDVLLGVAGDMPGVSWGAVAALMVMHVVVVAVAVPVLVRVLPLPAGRRATA
ncbi:hypothetical protein INN71_07075 [Nocardioides sp. ChNu-153]|uniref:DUF6069 family protein n=1 Tax=unclassified Nocardioides TaxID=2615069 RepID=UPI00240617BB|nr:MULTISPECIES: DUF6069 family protein [unclassified Nocardioides]MDF9716699.1 hypothetical protein [Nocardioides sp. ChNu-99]MDN7121151.1 hypothetical protein [Nocardioides sp. ChNu-153]